MKFPTKQKRLVAIFDAYLKRSKKTGATTDEVADWAMANDLWPVPTRLDSETACTEWEQRFQAATEKP